MEELEQVLNGGNFAKVMWCGDKECEKEIKDRFQATFRVMPFDQTPIDDKCVCGGEKATIVAYVARAY